MTVFIALLLTAIAFVFIAYPLLKQSWNPSTDSIEDDNLQELQSRRDTTYSMLKELEFDFQLGILSEDDYQELDTRYKQKAVSILKDLDNLDKGTDIEDELEKQISKLRQSKGRFCTQCGEKYQEDDRFCSHCGAQLRQEESSD